MLSSGGSLTCGVDKCSQLVGRDPLRNTGLHQLESVSEKLLTLKTVLLVALSSLKRVGDLQALSISLSCMDFAPGLVKVLLQPRPDYLPRVTSNPFCFHQVVLEAFSHANVHSLLSLA